MRRYLKGIVATLFALTFVATSVNNVNAAPKQKRLGGADRFKTCSSVVQDGWTTSQYAILVNGENFPDSLSAAVLAKKYNAPLVLTKNSVLDGNAKSELQRLGTKNILIVGGDFVIKPAVENEIKKLGAVTERISGKDRYATSVAIAEKIGVSNGIILATGSDYTDALSIAPIAAKLQMPILLVPKDSLPEVTANFIKGKSIPKTYVIGGTDIISDKVTSAFPNVQRITGSDKYERNINIIKAFESEFDFDNAILAYSEGFADALSGTAYAALNNNPIVLIGRNPAAVTKGYIKNKDISNLTILGGAAGITDNTVDNLYNENTAVGELKVHYINVGQADSILITQGGKNMLIDAGNNADSALVVDYLKKQGISKLDYVIGTHPHEDHIGGLDTVINVFDIGTIYMPKVTSTTETYKDVITAISNKGKKITVPNVGSTFNVGDAVATILAPNNSSYADINNYSIAIKLKFGNNSFIFMGDAEDISEGEILAKQLDLEADVLKVGHHGSSSSTTQAFLNKVNPKYAVISVGKGNDYGHPHKSTMDRLKAKGVTVYRTDENGTIVATSNGSNITFNTNPGSYNGNVDKNDNEDNKGNSNNSSSNNTANKNVKILSVDLVNEIVTIKNNSNQDINMTGWKLVSVEGNQTYNFPSGYTLKAGGTITIASGKSTGTLKWTGSYIWNNDGDAARLYDSSNTLISSR